MFNKTKKVAKKFSWHYLRASQRAVFDSAIGRDDRVDTRKLFAAIGCFAIHDNIITSDLNTATREELKGYIFEIAPNYIHDILAEFRMSQLERSFFLDCYSNMRSEYLRTQQNGEDGSIATLLLAVGMAIKEEFLNDDGFNYVFDKYKEEIVNIGYDIRNS